MADPVIPRAFFERQPTEVAPELLGWVLEHETWQGLVALRISEVEAYAGEADPGSHAYRGRTRRNATMFGGAGHIYVYFTYGMHWCMNVVCLGPGVAAAVLVRAGQVVEGSELARRRRSGHVSDRDLARGPARLTRALGVDGDHDGADACNPASPLRIRARPAGDRQLGANAATVRTSPRTGVGAGAEVPWRYYLEGDPTVSTYRPHARRRSRARPAT